MIKWVESWFERRLTWTNRKGTIRSFPWWITRTIQIDAISMSWTLLTLFLGKVGFVRHNRDWVQGWIQHCKCIWDYFLECCTFHVEGRCNCWDIQGRNNWILPIHFDIDKRVVEIQEEEGQNRFHCRCIHQDILDNVLCFEFHSKRGRGCEFERKRRLEEVNDYESRKQIQSIQPHRCMWEDCIHLDHCMLLEGR